MKKISDVIRNFFDLYDATGPCIEEIEEHEAEIDSKGFRISGPVIKKLEESESRECEKIHHLYHDLVDALAGSPNAKLETYIILKEIGLMSIPEELHDALRKAGAKSGLMWKKEKDTMHYYINVEPGQSDSKKNPPPSR
jgi:hypothetical protein